MIYIGIVLIVVVNEPPQSDQAEVAPEVERSEPEVSQGSDGFRAYCRQCGWDGHYPTYTRSKQALGAHKRWCAKMTGVERVRRLWGARK